jgi:hypothetical protein
MHERKIEMTEQFQGFFIVELMGHKRMVGFVSEVEIAGSPFLRVDAPVGNEKKVTQFYSSGAVYCLTPTTEETVKRLSTLNHPEPVQQWELPLFDGRDDGDDGEDIPH